MTPCIQIARRTVLKHLGVTGACVALGTCAPDFAEPPAAVGAAAPSPTRVPAATQSALADGMALNAIQGLQQLLDGNQRFVLGQTLHPRQTQERRTELSASQQPFACIVGCSDSRVDPVVVFDQGLGDLFVIRLAGNIVDDMALGSLEYAAEHLGVPLVMVLGHKKCGAVTAAVDAVQTGSQAHGHISRLVNAIEPAVEQAKGQPGDVVDNSIRANVALVVSSIETSQPLLAELVAQGKLMVVGGYYDLDSGSVEVIAPRK